MVRDHTESEADYRPRLSMRTVGWDGSESMIVLLICDRY